MNQRLIKYFYNILGPHDESTEMLSNGEQLVEAKDLVAHALFWKGMSSN
jgi:hypothetical protein